MGNKCFDCYSPPALRDFAAEHRQLQRLRGALNRFERGQKLFVVDQYHYERKSNVNNITTLRDHLFGVMDSLRNPNKEARLDCQTAEAICLAAKRLIETAEVEITFRKVMGDKIKQSDFMSSPKRKQLARLRSVA